MSSSDYTLAILFTCVTFMDSAWETDSDPHLYECAVPAMWQVLAYDHCLKYTPVVGIMLLPGHPPRRKDTKHNADETRVKILARILLVASLLLSLCPTTCYNLMAPAWIFTVVKLYRGWLSHFTFVVTGQNARYFMDDILNCVTPKDINCVSFL
jgi:hypothetical protein